MSTLGNTIRKARTEIKLSGRTFANCVGISAAYLCDIELDRRVPAEEVLRTIARLLGLKASNLLLLVGRVDARTKRFLEKHPSVLTLVSEIAVARLTESDIAVLQKSVDGMGVPRKARE